MRYFFVFITFFGVLCIFSCSNKRVYDQIININKAEWMEETKLEYKIFVSDPTESYQLYYTLRYTNEYPYYNLYVKRFLYDSTGKLISEKLQGMDIFNPKTGVPYGSGMSKTYDFDVLSETNFSFPHKGNYTIKIQQYMRQPVLKGIKAFGIRIQKKEEK